MSQYLLITVCEREIAVEWFTDFKAARAQMLEELGEEFATSAHNPNDGGETWRQIAAHTKFDDYAGEEYNFAFGATWAWSNLDRDWNMDWKIVEVA